MQKPLLMKKDTFTVTAIFHIKTNYVIVQKNAFSLVKYKNVRRFLSQEVATQNFFPSTDQDLN